MKISKKMSLILAFFLVSLIIFLPACENAGKSGTGKTKIAQLFADYICQSDKNADKRIAFISVRPDWMDNKGLLGYYNIFTEKYQTTDMLNVLLRAVANPDDPYFVILDEMNLAKVEHYFSDFLSILESRTVIDKKGKAIRLHSSGDTVYAEDGNRIPEATIIPPIRAPSPPCQRPQPAIHQRALRPRWRLASGPHRRGCGCRFRRLWVLWGE